MPTADSTILHDYTHVLERAIVELRMRIRYEDDVSTQEVHDLLDAVHNIPKMLRDCGGWHVPENINADLLRYDKKWVGHGGSSMRRPLMGHLKNARAGEYDKGQDDAESPALPV
jgi:hypothetical protein